jgi:hypothetical protein
MTIGQHFIISWVVANSKDLDRRSRALITLSGLLPDVDGVGYLIDKTGLIAGYHMSLYEKYHHVLGHNLLTGLLLSLLFVYYCKNRMTVFWLCLLAFHLHLLCDLAGSMGPDGYKWPIYYLFPFSSDYELVWSGQWELSSLRNSLIGILFFFVAVYQARFRKVTFFDFFSKRLECTVTKIATQRGFFQS